MQQSETEKVIVAEGVGVGKFTLPKVGKITLPLTDGRMTVPVSGRLSADHGGSLLQAARAGLGILLQPGVLVPGAIEQGRLVPPLEAYSAPALALHVLYAPDRRVTPKLRSFLD
jgi:DNA-binding transcriptional LysR family regulator